MSYFYILLASILLSFSGAGDIPHSELEKGFNDNDANRIVSLAKEKILMKVLNDEGAYSQAQAKLILKDFFQSHPMGKFDFIFKGKPSDNGSFSIGNYVYKDKTFRVTVHFKKSGANYQVETLNIE